AIVFFKNKLINFVKDKPIFMMSGSMYPGDRIMGNLPISGNDFEPLTVFSKGEYVIYITVTNKNTGNVVAIDKLNLMMG
ncbi:hypothetical protein D6764_03705, partial [Candidatus Woesearchaeota archaeon]